MASFCQAQNKRLTLIFKDYLDLKDTAKDLLESMIYLLQKYRDQDQTAPLVVILDVPVLEGEANGVRPGS